MELRELLEIADKAYPDGLIMQWYEFLYGERRGRGRKFSPGDTLAEFICTELYETYDEEASTEAQLEEAVRVMETAEREVREVGEALAMKYEEIVNEGGKK